MRKNCKCSLLTNTKGICMKKALYMFALLGLLACGEERKDESHQNAKNAILQTERDFEELVATKGVAEGFAFYADDSAVVQRRDALVRGKEAIRKNYLNWRYTNIVLKWTPDFVDVASSGDLGYTYGHYFFSAIDSTGAVVRDSGIFHTVWKRQQNGTWRYVWD
jgi:ketosteroid isomerase-like protein